MVELEYDEFSGTCLMPSLIVALCVLASLIPLQSVIICILCTLVTFKRSTCVRLALLLVLSLTFSVCPGRSIPMALMALLRSLVGHNTNVTGYPFLDGTWAVSFLSFLFSFLSILASQHLF